MTLHNEQREIHEKLQYELRDVRFTKKEEVLARTHKKSVVHFLNEWWNKELSISLVSLGLIAVFFIVLTVAPTILYQPGDAEIVEIIEVGNSFYPKQLLEETRR